MKPLYILPFDHRSSFAKMILGFEYPVKTAAEAKKVTNLKKIIFEAAKQAWIELEKTKAVGILTEEEFGSDILLKARGLGITRAVTVEKSGVPLFEFQYGEDFASHLEKYKPTYAKVLIRYNCNDKKKNEIQNARLKTISDFCKQHEISFMLEVLLDGAETRFTNMKRMIVALEKAGIKPSVWKLEGLEEASQWKAIKKLTGADLIILGRGESKREVETWVREAAKSGVVRGFAIGRTIFMSPLKKYCSKKITRDEAVNSIAKNYLDFIKLFETNLCQ
jgi:5-dehydro-2-deoxygluconokinase